jgi:hypothetical protein
MTAPLCVCGHPLADHAMTGKCRAMVSLSGSLCAVITAVECPCRTYTPAADAGKEE